MTTHVELVIIEFIILAIVCFILIRYYKGKMVTIDVAAVVYLSWVLGFAGILLLPYDISVAVVDGSKSLTLDNVWNFIYWRFVDPLRFFPSFCDYDRREDRRGPKSFFFCDCFYLDQISSLVFRFKSAK